MAAVESHEVVKPSFQIRVGLTLQVVNAPVIEQLDDAGRLVETLTEDAETVRHKLSLLGVLAPRESAGAAKGAGLLERSLRSHQIPSGHEMHEAFGVREGLAVRRNLATFEKIIGKNSGGISFIKRKGDAKKLLQVIRQSLNHRRSIGVDAGDEGGQAGC